MDENRREDISPSERIIRDMVRDMVLDEAYIAERNGESLHARLEKVISDLYRSGTGLLVLTKIGWPKHVSDVINELLADRIPLLREEEYQTQVMKSEQERDKAKGVDLDEDSEVIEFEGRYFVRPVRTKHAVGVGVDLEDE